jgi:hypothetical protein
VVRSDTKTAWLAKQVPPVPDEKHPDIPFPNWKRVIPQDKPNFITKFNGFAYSSKVRGCNYVEMVKFVREFPDPTVLNLDYLADLGTSLVWDVGWFSGNKAITFTSGDRFAVIMPMQYDAPQSGGSV